VPIALYNTSRLVCNLPARHHGKHRSFWSGWFWTDDGPLERTWVCQGQLGNGQPHGYSDYGSEDRMRVRGWRIGRRPNGDLDPLCPQCGAPDPIARSLARDLEQSIRRV